MARPPGDFANVEGKALDALTAITVFAHVDMDLTLLHWHRTLGGFLLGHNVGCVRHFVQLELHMRIPLAIERMPEPVIRKAADLIADGDVLVLRVLGVDDANTCRYCAASILPFLGPKLEDL